MLCHLYSFCRLCIDMQPYLVEAASDSFFAPDPAVTHSSKALRKLLYVKMVCERSGG